MTRRFLLVALALMSLALLSALPAEAVHQASSLHGSHVERNYGLLASPFISGQYTHTPFEMRQQIDAHYFRFSGVISEDTLAYQYQESLPSDPILRKNTRELIWAAESVYGFTWLSSSLQAFSLSTFGGVGYRALGRDLTPFCCMPVEESSWFYGTMGLRVDWKVTDKFRMSPEIAWRIPLAIPSATTTQAQDEVKVPFRQYIDVQLPMVYQLDQNWQAFLVGTVERIYVASSPAELLSRGIPLSDMLGRSTTQGSISFGLQFPF